MNTIIYFIAVALYFLINYGFSSTIAARSKKLSRSRIFWCCCILSPIFGVLVAILDELTEIRANTDEMLNIQKNTNNNIQ